MPVAEKETEEKVISWDPFLVVWEKKSKGKIIEETVRPISCKPSRTTWLGQ